MAASGRKEGRVESFNCFMHWGCALVCALGLEVITIWIQRGSVSQDCVCLRERDNCCNCPQIITVLPSRTQLKSHFLSGTTWKYSLFLTGANLVSKWSLDNWCFLFLPIQTIVELTQERDCVQLSPLATCPSQSPGDSPSMRRTESRQHLSVELADAKAKIRRLRQEL